MQIASRNFTARLTMANAYRFTNGSKMVPWLGVENPIKFRVMSTPTWPAPYYQRMVKAYPVRHKDKGGLLHGAVIADDSNWLSAKEQLRKTLRGREIVEYTENHVKTDTYLIRQTDTLNMVEGYVNDIVQFMDLANKQNKRILSGTTLI